MNKLDHDFGPQKPSSFCWHGAHAARTLLLLAACALCPNAGAADVLTPDRSFGEFDGEYESNFVVNAAGIAEIEERGITTMGVRENCDDWKYTGDAPYMGLRAYSVRCVGNPFLGFPGAPEALSKMVVRSEQHFLQGLRPGEDSQRSLSFAFRLTGVDPVPRANSVTGGAGSGWIAQLHGEGLPFILAWQAYATARPSEDPTENIPEPGYYLYAGAKYHKEVLDKKGRHAKPERKYEQRQPYKLLGRLTPGTWVRVMIQVNLRKRIGHECPDTIGDESNWTVALMDNATGLWGTPLEYPFLTGQRLGNSYEVEGEAPNETRGPCLPPAKQSYNFKIGQYVVLETNQADYDNVSYGKRWIHITKNHLIGYKKSVLRLPFEETSQQSIARRVEDRSYTRNNGSAGDPTSDYNNDGVILGSVSRIATDVNGRALHFPGTAGSYVKVPIDPTVRDDFDVGNYMTVSTWFRTDATPDENKGLVMIDEFSDRWKLLLYMKGNGLAFGVRHRVVTGQPGIYSRLDHAFPSGRYSDCRWHLVTGTFNRFAPDGMRVKLYIDGEKVMEGAGNDLPILRGEKQLVVGKYSEGGFFRGDIDDVGLFNYTMTGAEVRGLWQERPELNEHAELTAPQPCRPAIAR